MAEPLTPKATIEESKDDMKIKMELFIMKIQVNLEFYSNLIQIYEHVISTILFEKISRIFSLKNKQFSNFQSVSSRNFVVFFCIYLNWVYLYE